MGDRDGGKGVDRMPAQNCKQTALGGEGKREKDGVWLPGGFSEGRDGRRVVTHGTCRGWLFPRSYHSIVWQLQGMCHTCMCKRA